MIAYIFVYSSKFFKLQTDTKGIRVLKSPHYRDDFSILDSSYSWSHSREENEKLEKLVAGVQKRGEFIPNGMPINKISKFFLNFYFGNFSLIICLMLYCDFDNVNVKIILWTGLQRLKSTKNLLIFICFERYIKYFYTVLLHLPWTYNNYQ